MITGLVVLKMVLMPSRQRRARRKNSGPRWSMIGVSMARRMRSGSGEGPGMCRKWRPMGREEFLDICFPGGVVVEVGSAIRQVLFHSRTRLAAMKDECDSQSSLLAGLLWRFRHSQRRDLA